MPGEAAGSGGNALDAGAGAGWENGECGGMEEFNRDLWGTGGLGEGLLRGSRWAK